MIRKATVEGGRIIGIPAADPRITAFKGIPFAAPPVGENRWRAPQPVVPWEGELDCSRFKPISMQHVPGLDTISTSGLRPRLPKRSFPYSSGSSAAACVRAIPPKWNLTASASPAAALSS